MNLDILSLMRMLEDSIDIMPIFSKDQDKKFSEQNLPVDVSILPLRNTVLFPGIIVPIAAGRTKSLQLVNDVFENGKLLGVISQKSNKIEDPEQSDLYTVGTLAKIVKLLKGPDGSTTALLQGIKRFEVEEFTAKKPYFSAKIKYLQDKIPTKRNKEFPLIIDSIKDLSEEIISENNMMPNDSGQAIRNMDNFPLLINILSSNISLTVEERQSLLENSDLKSRSLDLMAYMSIELQKLNLKNDIQFKVKKELDQQQKEYFLNQQIRTLQEELGGNSVEDEVNEMKTKASSKKWNEETAKHFDKELARFSRLNPQMPEHSIQRNFLEFMLDLPWNENTSSKIDLKKAKQTLDNDHFGLDDVKERILEHLAVLKLKNDMKSPIICLYGPPGVGKTSLGKSIAEALNRKYIRMSLGGLHDESEIRGHRKTYIGAMPGRLLQNIRKAGASNPVFILDEIDKMGSNAHGDPTSAMLEVLDPEQNNSFYDNYLEQGFDLSQVMFIATANNISNIPAPLRDRMEMIDISGYTTEEKIEIARKHLLPKQISDHGLQTKDVVINKKELEFIVEGYTRESGVRKLNQQLAKIVRNIAKSIALEEDFESKISKQKITDILGISRENDRYEDNRHPGVVVGLAWTQVGGDILYIESILSPGKGNLTLTGNLGNVMKESATIALEFIKSQAKALKIDQEILDQNNIHIHVPEGATPKDGPSAGITMLTSLVSTLTNRKVKPNLAMTGEITLRGKVLPVGGIKEKILAAKRANIKEIILCQENEKDIAKINQDYLKGLKFHYVKEMKEVLDIALI